MLIYDTYILTYIHIQYIHVYNTYLRNYLFTCLLTCLHTRMHTGPWGKVGGLSRVNVLVTCPKCLASVLLSEHCLQAILVVFSSLCMWWLYCYQLLLRIIRKTTFSDNWTECQQLAVYCQLVCGSVVIKADERAIQSSDLGNILIADFR